ncbi:MAG: restriction endonuclease [Tenacibaculum sp.]|nr:restriction endonuclease [Tenacibaculum sp.]
MNKKKEDFKVWMVRAGRGSIYIDNFINESIIAVGWNEIGKLNKGIDYDGLKEKLFHAYPDWSQGKLNQCTGQIWRFFNDFNIGDKVITYDSSARSYFLGEIKSDYLFDENYIQNHYRKVEWDGTYIYRDDLEISSKNTLGAIMTVFEVSLEVYDDICHAHPGYLTDEEVEEFNQRSLEAEKQIKEQYEKEALETLKEDAVARSTEFIKDIVYNLNWEETELLVAGILRGMGYKTRLTSRGSDLGSDIMASPDGLEMVEPIIKTEVKHKTKSKDKIGAPDLRNFIGGLRPPTRGIYVSTTGFTKEAQYEAERANFQITLVDLDRLVDLIVEYYEQLDTETKALVPLRKMYWPV